MERIRGSLVIISGSLVSNIDLKVRHVFVSLRNLIFHLGHHRSFENEQIKRLIQISLHTNIKTDLHIHRVKCSLQCVQLHLWQLILLNFSKKKGNKKIQMEVTWFPTIRESNMLQNGQTLRQNVPSSGG